MTIETPRIQLRPWREQDAQALYHIAKSPTLLPLIGWSAHESPEDSLASINEVLALRSYAVTLKETDTLIGSVGLKLEHLSSLFNAPNQAEIVFFLGESYFGQGLMTEAVNTFMIYVFETLGLETLWFGRYEGNDQAAEIQNACGFEHKYTIENAPCEKMDDTRTLYVSNITKDNFQSKGILMYQGQ